MTPELAKTKSHEWLRALKLEINDHLPVIEALEDLRPQEAQSVAARIVILNHVIGIGFGAQPSMLRKSLTDFGLFERVSKKEQALLNKESHTPQEKVDCTWMVECVQSLSWCLHLVGLDPLRHCDDNLASHFPRPFADPSGFISQASLRSIDEIYQQADFHYRLHWAARNARLLGRQSPIQEGLIRERRKALDWVIGVEADWDEIRGDT